MGGKRSRPDRVLLLVTGGRDRELLGTWLADEPGYEAVGIDGPDDLADVEYDLCLVDARSFDRYGERLLARRESAAPCYLPALLVVPGGRDEREGDGRAVPAGETARAVLDDVVELPVGKATLRRRLENLLRGRHASLELTAREEQYRELLRLTPETILLVREGTIVYANRAAAALFGVDDAAGLSGRAITGLVEGTGAARLQQVVGAVEREGELDEFVELDLAVDGTERTVELAGVTVTYEGEPATQLVVRDVTEERRRSERLTLYARAMEAAAQGVTIADARRDDEPLVYANPAFERITGYDAAEILGRNCRFLQGEGTDPEAVAEVREAIEERRPVSVELRNYRADGTPFWNRLDVIPVRNDAGEVTHFLGLQRDVTRRREREQRVAVLDRVLRHNLRNQLNVVRGQADRILAGDEVDPGTARTAASGILRATDELLDIADQARRFREVVAGERREPGVRDVAGVLAAAVAEVGAEYPDATVDVDLPDRVPVYAHDVVGMAFLGVVEMLAEATDGAADVAVRAGELRPGTVTVEVVDRASGFSAADLGVVAEGVETPVAHPQGVELWLLRWSVEHSGGEFDVDTGGDPPRIRLRFRRADDRVERGESTEASAGD
jgi:PAS domain S-box-containing protein